MRANPIDDADRLQLSARARVRKSASDWTDNCVYFFLASLGIDDLASDAEANLIHFAASKALAFELLAVKIERDAAASRKRARARDKRLENWRLHPRKRAR